MLRPYLFRKLQRQTRYLSMYLGVQLVWPGGRLMGGEDASDDLVGALSGRFGPAGFPHVAFVAIAQSGEVELPTHVANRVLIGQEVAARPHLLDDLLRNGGMGHVDARVARITIPITSLSMTYFS